jgi:hypothetical protein
MSIYHEQGEIDFGRRRAHCAHVQVVRGQRYRGETLWDGPRMYFRATATEAWDQVPLIGSLAGGMPYSTPLWLLDALCAVRDDAWLVGEDSVRGAPTSHVRVTVDTAKAVECSPEGLALPRRRGGAFPAHFPAEVWLDERGRISRMSCAWPQRRRRRVSKRFGPPHWVFTEWWDFGVPIDIPALRDAQ